MYMKTQKVYLLLPIPNLRDYHPNACSGKPNPSKRQMYMYMYKFKLLINTTVQLHYETKVAVIMRDHNSN